MTRYVVHTLATYIMERLFTRIPSRDDCFKKKKKYLFVECNYFCFCFVRWLYFDCCISTDAVVVVIIIICSKFFLLLAMLQRLLNEYRINSFTYEPLKCFGVQLWLWLWLNLCFVFIRIGGGVGMSAALNVLAYVFESRDSHNFNILWPKCVLFIFLALPKLTLYAPRLTLHYEAKW